MRLAWLTDIHLNFLERDARLAFATSIARSGADAVLISGDIAEAPSLSELLGELAATISRPVWFVLGNHDFYRSAIAPVRARMAELTRGHPHLRWLPACGVVRVADDVAVVGHDGWGDARLGNVATTPVMLSDFFLIEDLARVPHAARPALLQALGDEAARYLAGAVTEALAWARHVIVVTHVPPYRETCWHEGRLSDDDWLPYFTCAAVGAALRAAMIDRPDAAMTVLCGHTHGGGEATILPNLRVVTGGAEYGEPVVQRIIDTAAL